MVPIGRSTAWHRRPLPTPFRRAGSNMPSQGAAILAEASAGGKNVDLIESLELRHASGTILDGLRLRPNPLSMDGDHPHDTSKFALFFIRLAHDALPPSRPTTEPGDSTSTSSTSRGGAATLIVTPERESILIDSGWPGLEDRDPKRIVHVLKEVAGLDHLDHLVTTHWHTDHFGGVEGLAKLVRDRPLLGPRPARPDEPDGDKADFPDGPKADDPLGIAYRKASEGKRQPLRPGDDSRCGATRGASSSPRAARSSPADRRRPPNPALRRAPRPTCRPTPATTPGASRSVFRLGRSTSSTAAT